MRLKLTNTKRAMAQYDQGDPERRVMLDKAETNEDVDRWERAELGAQKLVKFAFYQDTVDRNSLENCMVAGLDWLRDLIAKEDP